MNKATISFTLVLVIFGMLLSMQFKTQQQIINSLAYQDARDLITIYHSMRDKMEDLSLTTDELRQRKSKLAVQASREVELIELTEEQINQLKVINGEVSVAGPGITVVITRDAPLLHYDLIDLVNELWVSGAEAIAINEHRITSTTFIQQVGPDKMLINNEVLLFPFVIKAIGDPHTLDKGLTFTGGLIENWRNFYGIYPSITRRDKITIHPVKIPETTQSVGL